MDSTQLDEIEEAMWTSLKVTTHDREAAGQALAAWVKERCQLPEDSATFKRLIAAAAATAQNFTIKLSTDSGLDIIDHNGSALLLSRGSETFRGNDSWKTAVVTAVCSSRTKLNLPKP